MIRSLKTRIKSFKDANALLRTQNNQLTAEKSEQQAQIDYLTAEAARLEEHRAYVRNAYDGLKHKHDQLATENLKAMARVLAAENKAKESAANAAMWQIRAERAEQQIIDVKTEHDSLLTKIREHIRAVGNELFDLSDKV
jgi:predicted nuclease with TOPRIM domain